MYYNGIDTEGSGSMDISRQKSITYKIFLIFCILVHGLILSFALAYDLDLLLYYNIASISIYSFCYVFQNKIKNIIFYIGFIEIMAQSMVSFILLGNSFGFSIYYIALIPISYFMLYSNSVKHHIIIATATSLLSFVLYITCYILSRRFTPIYSNSTLDSISNYIYIANIFVIVIALAFFSIIFINEIEKAYDILCNKNRELDNLANTDPLTGLCNRRTTTDYINQAYNSTDPIKQEFSLVMCDIDNFKMINDTKGHEFGDQILIHISTLLKRLTRNHDIVCRWGGEEFLILLNNINKDMAKTIAERIRKVIATTPVQCDKEDFFVTMTFGVASASEAVNYAELFKIADSRMYEGKVTGKNKVV